MKHRLTSSLELIYQLIVQPGIDAVRKYYRPFACIQLCSIFLVIAYYSSSELQEICDIIAQFKETSGYFFGFLSFAIAGSIIPELAKLMTRMISSITRKQMNQILFLFCFFGCCGLLVDLFYRLQTFLFGHDTKPQIVIYKIALDQFVFTPLIMHPFSMLATTLWEKKFNFRSTLVSITWYNFLKRMGPVFLIGWLYWIPMTFCIYSLPSPLQLPFCVLAVAAWSLLFVFITSQKLKD
ncbi:MAG: hypothetical protein AAGA18_12085 [Verrucomicrobiota bacterium]